MDVPSVEVRADGLSVDSSVYVGGRATPTLINAYRNFIEVGQDLGFGHTPVIMHDLIPGCYCLLIWQQLDNVKVVISSLT